MNNHHKGIPVVIAAEEPIVRYGIRRLLEAEQDLVVIGEAADSLEAVRMIQELKPAVLMLDLAMSDSGLNVLSRLASLHPGVRTIVMVAAVKKTQIVSAFKCGAHGVLFKDSATQLLLNCVRSVIAGQYWAGEKEVSTIVDAIRGFMLHSNGVHSPKPYGLTPRELEIVATIVTGCSNKDVGRKFSITERTVKHHLSNIYDKLGVSNRLELAVFAINHHLEGNDSRHLDLLNRTTTEPEYQEA
ncbi:MAG TPA: response regulator transcription factor [Terriglobia bacterium]|nr:response regulator transcription factor [Terriglobia bacterium]